MSSEPKMDPTPEEIEKMLEESRMKTIPPHILKGFKDDVLRRIEAEQRVKPGRWFGSSWKLPRVGMSVGAGALACLIVASIAVLTMEKPVPVPAAKDSAAFQVASVPLQSPAVMTAPTARAFDKMVAPVVSAQAVRAVASAPAQPAVKRKLTVEEELRLIEEFDNQRFFIRQDITEDDLAAA